MIPHELLATAAIPGQRTELKLYRHDRDFMLLIHGAELMSSRVHGSEQLLAELALEKIPQLDEACVLVGGLGMGFTLRSVLDLVGEKATVEVVEVVPDIFEWHKEWLGPLNDNAVDDPRVTTFEGDVVPRIRAAKGRYDAILLDVDNGPEGLVRDANDRLYNTSGLQNARVALKPGGVLAVWSVSHHDWFTQRLERAGFEVEDRWVRARRDKGPKRTIWLARKRES